MDQVNTRTVDMLMRSPADCIFICATEADAAAVRKLALPLGRKDLRVDTVEALAPGKLYAGTGFPRDVLVDWQVKLTPTQEAVLREHRNFVIRYRPSNQEQLI